MSRKFFGSGVNGDYLEGYLPVKGSGQNDMLPLNNNGNLPALSKKAGFTCGKIEMTNFAFGVPYKKKKMAWMNIHSDMSNVQRSELDMYGMIFKIMNENGIF